jgi:hypothetical protein
VARSRNVYTSSPILKTRHYFTRRERFYDDFKYVANNNIPYFGFDVKFPIFSIVAKFLVPPQIFMKSLQYKISWKYVQWEASTRTRADRRGASNRRFSWVCDGA